MIRRTPPPRSGYTLLEILIASVIGLLLMAALYAAFTVILEDTSIGRDLTAESNLSRGIINRVGIDLASPVGMLGPKSGGDPGAGGGSSAEEETETTSTDATTAEPTGTTSTDAVSPVTSGSDIPFQAGIVGVDTQLVIFLSRSPDYLRNRSVLYDPSVISPSDLTKVTYYMHSSGRGLCRQERPWVTSDGVWNSTEPDRSTEEFDMIAPEVVGVLFEYGSGSGFLTSWDGSGADANGASCLGPPRAVRMTITLEFILRDGTTTTKDVSHTYPIHSAVGLGGSTYVPPDDTGTTTTDTGGTP